MRRIAATLLAVLLTAASLTRTQGLTCVASKPEVDLHPLNSLTNWAFSYAGSVAKMSGTARAIVKKVLSIEQAKDVGARVRRSVGRPEVRCASLAQPFIFIFSNSDSISSFLLFLFKIKSLFLPFFLPLIHPIIPLYPPSLPPHLPPSSESSPSLPFFLPLPHS